MSNLGLEYLYYISRGERNIFLCRRPGLTDLVGGAGWRDSPSFCFPDRVKFTRRLLQLYKFSNCLLNVQASRTNASRCVPGGCSTSSAKKQLRG